MNTHPAIHNLSLVRMKKHTAQFERPWTNMQESVKLKVPYVLDDPLVGRCSSPFPLTGGYDHITITECVNENETPFVKN